MFPSFCKYFNIYRQFNLSFFHEIIYCFIFQILPNMYFLILASGGLPMQFLYRILRFLSPVCKLSIDPNSWLVKSIVLFVNGLHWVYFVVVFRQGWDNRSRYIFKDMVILEGISYGISKFVQDYGNLCLYYYKTSMLMCGHVWRTQFFTNFFNPFFCRLEFVWDNLKCTNANGFASRDKPFLL